MWITTRNTYWMMKIKLAFQAANCTTSLTQGAVQWVLFLRYKTSFHLPWAGISWPFRPEEHYWLCFLIVLTFNKKRERGPRIRVRESVRARVRVKVRARFRQRTLIYSDQSLGIRLQAAWVVWSEGKKDRTVLGLSRSATYYYRPVFLSLAPFYPERRVISNEVTELVEVGYWACRSNVRNLSLFRLAMFYLVNHGEKHLKKENCNSLFCKLLPKVVIGSPNPRGIPEAWSGNDIFMSLAIESGIKNKLCTTD
jgi:hypothetical protein